MKHSGMRLRGNACNIPQRTFQLVSKPPADFSQRADFSHKKTNTSQNRAPSLKTDHLLTSVSPFWTLRDPTATHSAFIGAGWKAGALLFSSAQFGCEVVDWVPDAHFGRYLIRQFGIMFHRRPSSSSGRLAVFQE
jgi:hypothetical protein